MIRYNKELNGVFAIILASFLWGTTGTVASFSPDISAMAIGAFSTGSAGILLVVTARKALFSHLKVMVAQPWVLLTGTFSVAIYPLAFYSSMRLSGVAIGTVVSLASAPMFSAILECLISKKLISRQWVFSFIIGALGIILLTMGKDLRSLSSDDALLQSIGIVLGLIAGLTYANYSWAAKHFIDSGVNAQSAVASLFGFAALILLPSLWFTGENLFSSIRNICVSLYMAIIPMFLGYLLFGFGLKRIEASKVTLITLIEPLVATILAVIIIGEKLQMIGWLGMVLLCCCLIMQSIEFGARAKLNAFKGDRIT
ncbi:DMT family transporter [Thalassotalea atypica]|uniref:DMT family transporter n=1 Tax=Thalassotalea atypica TaxID=2054316 RepID=UPI002572A5E9|nr:EamA family transporter [Thalassotalea atypica]